MNPDAPRPTTSPNSADAAAAAGAARVMASDRLDRLPPLPPSLLERVAVLEVEMRAIDRRVTAHGEQLDDHGPRVDRLERIVGEIRAQLFALDARLGKIEARLCAVGVLVYTVVEVGLRYFGR